VAINGYCTGGQYVSKGIMTMNAILTLFESSKIVSGSRVVLT